MDHDSTEHHVRTIPTARNIARAAATPCWEPATTPTATIRRWLLALAHALVLWGFCAVAQARNIVHIVAKGQTLGSIAQHYGTTVRAIELENRLRDGRQLYPGQKLRITGVAESRETVDDDDDDDPPCEARTAGSATSSRRWGARGAGLADPYARKPARAGFLALIRYGEVFRGPLLDASGKVLPQAHARISRLMRDLRANEQLPIDPRLLRLIAEVSDHFGGRTIVVVSGYREFTPRQFARHSRHSYGRAIDMRILGVPNEVLRDYCLSLPGVGVGYYPNSTFVHLDNRGYRSAWVDYSAPGGAPRYTCRPGSEPAREREATRRTEPGGRGNLPATPGRNSGARRAAATPARSAGAGALER
jgi:hypothetical protein